MNLGYIEFQSRPALPPPFMKFILFSRAGFSSSACGYEIVELSTLDELMALKDTAGCPVIIERLPQEGEQDYSYKDLPFDPTQVPEGLAGAIEIYNDWRE